LVIDDDAGFLHLVNSILRKHGFEVLNASSGLKGLNMLGAEPDVIRVVLLDYSMPHLDGGETLKFVRQLAPNVKVIGVTAMKFDTIAKPYLDGVDWLLTKPVIATELVSAVNALIGDGQTASSAMQS
jgi:CheY-like chemotaxis protein